MTDLRTPRILAAGWLLAALLGCNSTPGQAGAQGPVGPQGPAGQQGPQGLPGNAGTMGLQGNPGAMGLQGNPGLNGTSGLLVNFLAATGTSTSATNDCAAPTATVYLPANSHFQVGVNGYNVQMNTGAFLPSVGAVFTPFNPVDAGVGSWMQEVYAPSTTVTVLSNFVNGSQNYNALFFPDSGVTATGYPLGMTPTYYNGGAGYVLVTPSYAGFVLDGTTTNAAYLSISGSYACSAACAGGGGGTCQGIADGWITGSVVTQPDAGM